MGSEMCIRDRCLWKLWGTKEIPEAPAKVPMPSDAYESLRELRDHMQHIISLYRAQQKTISRLEDELSAARQLAAETQLRQLKELTEEENEDLRQPTPDQHQHGIILYLSS